MSNSDLKSKYRKWRRPKAERRAETKSSVDRKKYRARLDRLVDLIVDTVQQKELCYYLEAPSESTLLLALAAEIDRSGGFMARNPDPARTGHSTREQSERASFMKVAYDRAIRLQRITLDKKSDSLLLYVYNPPKWILHRSDGQVLVDYIPNNYELLGKEVEPDTDSTFRPTGRVHALFRQWQQ
jgi:hypothetical protein